VLPERVYNADYIRGPVPRDLYVPNVFETGT
jgi:hypothetical protein